MIDIKFLRDHPDVVRASQKGRGENVELVDQILAIDEIKRAAINEFELLRQEQNVLSKSVGAAKGSRVSKSGSVARWAYLFQGQTSWQSSQP